MSCLSFAFGALIVGFIAGALIMYFVRRNPKNDQFNAKMDKYGDKAEKIHDKLKDKL